jgi:hypothetical protein
LGAFEDAKVDATLGRIERLRTGRKPFDVPAPGRPHASTGGDMAGPVNGPDAWLAGKRRVTVPR